MINICQLDLGTGRPSERRDLVRNHHLQPHQPKPGPEQCELASDGRWPYQAGDVGGKLERMALGALSLLIKSMSEILAG